MNTRILLVLLAATAPASAELLHQAPEAMSIRHRYEIPTTPAVAWQVLVHPERWWPESHTWSGSRSNLSLVPEAGGCFCERWDGGSSEHGRVVMAQPGRMLRLNAALGPLQEMAISGVLSISLGPEGERTIATVTYRVSGDAEHRLDQLAPIVNQVLGMQFGNFAANAALP